MPNTLIVIWLHARAVAGLPKACHVASLLGCCFPAALHSCIRLLQGAAEWPLGPASLCIAHTLLACATNSNWNRSKLVQLSRKGLDLDWMLVQAVLRKRHCKLIRR